MWVFDKINSMKKRFYKTGEITGSSYVKSPLRTNADFNLENKDNYCSLWSILSYLQPCDKDHLSRVSNYKQIVKELNIDGFDFSNGFECSDDHKFEKLNDLSNNIFELTFYQDQYNCKHNSIPIQISKNESDRVIDLLFYKNHYAPIKNLHVFLSDRHKNFICRRCLNSCTSEYLLVIQKVKIMKYLL